MILAIIQLIYPFARSTGSQAKHSAGNYRRYNISRTNEIQVHAHSLTHLPSVVVSLVQPPNHKHSWCGQAGPVEIEYCRPKSVHVHTTTVANAPTSFSLTNKAGRVGLWIVEWRYAHTMRRSAR